jgi:hypothetical protein
LLIDSRLQCRSRESIRALACATTPNLAGIGSIGSMRTLVRAHSPSK